MKRQKSTTAHTAQTELKQVKAGGGETHQQVDGTQIPLTTNQGLPVSDNQNSLRAGERGPTLLEDFVLREKITHFDHERTPERIMHEGPALTDIFSHTTR
jgi:catalase